MISSAVVIPEQPPTPAELPPSPSLKRRQSSFEPETNKRPRLETLPVNSSSLDYGSQASPPPSATSPTRRKSSTLTGVEEKKRGQRLFGSLLGTLSQTSSKPGSAQRKREDIEKRQIERIKAQNEEREEERRRRNEELTRTRKEEQKVWDEESRKVRWENMRAMANFLRTETEPKLYYKPWELRDEERNRIERQKEDVERDIDREMIEAGEKVPAQRDVAASPETRKEIDATDGNAGDVDGDVDGDVSMDAPPKPDPEDQSGQQKEELQQVKDPPVEEKPKEDEHHGEELVQGEEDDVIY